jgi:hypothetical protein
VRRGAGASLSIRGGAHAGTLYLFLMHFAKLWRALASASLVYVFGAMGMRVSAQTDAAPVIDPIPDIDRTVYNRAARESQQGFGLRISNTPTNATATGMPPGVYFSSNPPTQSYFTWMDSSLRGGLYNVTVTASNASGSSSRSFRWFVHPSMFNFIHPDKSSYTVGEVVTLTAEYSTAVVVTGSPYIQLWPGKNAVYSSGSGTTTLKFQATVSANDTTHDGLIVDRIAADGGTIATPDGVSANLIGPTSPDRVGGQAPRFDVVVPGSTPAAPAIMRVTPPDPGIYGRRFIFVSVNFNAQVTVTGSPSIGVRIGSTDVEFHGGFVSPNGTEVLFSYEIGTGPNDNGPLTITGPIRLNGGTIKGIDGTDAALGFTPVDAPSVIFDTTPPPAPVIGGVTPPSPTTEQSFTFSGTTEPGTSVVVIRGADSRGAVVDANGNWSATFSPLPEGTYQFTALARDQAGNGSPTSSATVTVQPTPTGRPTITSQPTSRTAAMGSPVTFSTATSAANATYQWQYNGAPIGGATSRTLTIDSTTPDRTGLYTAVVTDSGSFTLSAPAILGLTSDVKLLGAGQEVGSNIVHPNGNVYDQALLQGSAITLTADPGQVSRASWIGLSDEIVQAEFSGAGALSIVLTVPSGPAPARNYNQPDVAYMRGHAALIITGANETTNVSVFSVGRLTAVNQSIFRDDVAYEGVANLAYIAILSSNGNFGGIRAGNANFWSTRGHTGIYAPGVHFNGPVYVCEITATEEAIPVLMLGSATDTKIAGGDLLQTNGRAVQVSGLTQLRFVSGMTSAGQELPALACRGRLEENGQDVTARVVSP